MTRTCRMGAKGFGRDLEAASGSLHRRDNLQHAGSGVGGGRRRAAALASARLGLGRARHLLGGRWRMLILLLAALMVSSR